MLIVGPPGSGKTLYCLQFLRDGIADGKRCLYISCSKGFSHDKFLAFFADKNSGKTPSYINAFSGIPVSNETQASNGSRDVRPSHVTIFSSLLAQLNAFMSDKSHDATSLPTCVVLDSLTDLSARHPADEVSKFVANFYDLLKQTGNVMAFLTYAGTPSADSAGSFGSLVDGVVQLRMEDSGEAIKRGIRILSVKGMHIVPRWEDFHIAADGTLRFVKEDPSTTQAICKLCDREIVGPVMMESGSAFHSHCLDTYKKLGDIYGSHSMYSLQPGVVNANFFFIDIVGLSDPLLSVEKQIRKIEDLNSLIGSCEAFSRIPGDRKIILPTGDGMVVGFLVNPELPLRLSMQLHEKLRAFNARQSPDRRIGVRIGLSSGPVFVVSDINNNQNVWGPGIILARRVMDLGDNGHILLADNIAETLINLKDEYRSVIKLVTGDLRIKHGQLLRLYSAYSPEFGNSSRPSKIIEAGQA
jgi:KaiC/GvpD/RAD55 family RecA-like ATPase